jgi:transcriptional regulator with XRE-family HTH domain
MSFKEIEAKLRANPATNNKIAAAKAALERSVALHELRGGNVSQAELASILGVSQRRVSAIENAKDIQITTLRSYVETLGYHLEIAATNADGEHILLDIG